MKVKSSMNFPRVSQKTRLATRTYGMVAAKKLEAVAKTNAPWVDRTSNARNSIRGTFSWEGYKMKISLSGNMEYFVFLELAMEKRFAIIIPTIKENQNEVFTNFAKVVRGIV